VKLLLDTHVLIWLAEGLKELPPASRKLIDDVARKAGIYVSAISFWEVAMLSAKGRISLSQPLADWRDRVLSAPGLAELALTGDIGIEAAQLPGEMHSDPADRMLVATARIHRLRLATRDSRLLEYGEAGHAGVLEV
jgi:PIN domain nuclease of toxin-antitoxin system